MEKRTQITPTTDQKQDNKTQELVNARKDTLSKLKSEESKGFKWLNEYSRQFLASGYLTEGVTPEERIREIGDRAEEILQIPGYSDKFYGYMSEGFFSLASRKSRCALFGFRFTTRPALSTIFRYFVQKY